jgi:hypothetical protein
VKVTEYLISLSIVGGISAVVGFFCGARLGFQAVRRRRYAEREHARKRIHVLRRELEVVGSD